MHSGRKHFRHERDAMTYQEALVALDTLYSQLPAFVCQRKCQASCGVIVMTRVEWLRIQRKLGYAPKGKASLACPLLDKHGACRVHALRPLICRLYGLLDDSRMRCPFGCTPSAWVASPDGGAWLAAAETISQAVFPGPPAAAYAQGLSYDQVAPAVEQFHATQRARAAHRSAC